MALSKLPVEIILDIGENVDIKSLVSLSTSDRRTHSILTACVLKHTTAFQRLPTHILLAIGSESSIGDLASLSAVDRRCYSVLTSSLYARGVCMITESPEMKEAYFNPVAKAICEERPRTVTLFLANGLSADTWVNCYEERNEATDPWDYSLLHLSRDCEDTTIMRLLLQHGADPNKPHEYEGSTLHWVLDMAYPYSPMLEYVKLLLDYGADVNARGKFGHTPLHNAAYHNNAAAIPLLIGYGAKINAVDNYNRTPMTVAGRWGHLEVAKILRDYGADERFGSKD